MPNPSNVASPVVLVAYGRSGTSLLSNVFKRHSQVEFVGETAELILGTWQAVENVKGLVRTPVEDGRHVSFDELAARSVRSVFLESFPASKTHWMHKPIGVPQTLIRRGVDDSGMPDAAWYWKVLTQSFPDATFLTILRDPFDVTFSAKQYWGYEESGIWWSLACMAHLLLHEDCPVKFAVRYEELAADRERVTREVFAYCGIPFEERVLTAFDVAHVPQRNVDPDTSGSRGKPDSRSVLDLTKVDRRHFEKIRKLWAKYHHEFPIPPELEDPVAVAQPAPSEPGAPAPAVSEVDRLRASVAAQEQKIETLTGEVRRLNREFAAALGEKNARIEELTWQLHDGAKRPGPVRVPVK